MGILDDLNKTVSGGVSRVKFEARKLQKTTRLQGEVYELRQQVEATLRKLGQLTLDLHKQGQLHQPEVAALAAALQQTQDQITLKEQELQQAQAEAFVEPAPPPTAQQVPIDTSPQDLPADPPTQHVCPRCGFVSAANARFCPNCGTQVAS